MDPAFWTITSYYNPAGYARRLSNYRTFRERLAGPLLTVELSYGTGHELRPTDADVLIQLRGRDVLWQKERLLNVALQGLPKGCDKVAWVDCDVVFDRKDWTPAGSDLLERLPIVQLFGELYDLPRGVSIDDFDPDDADFAAHSLARKMRNKTASRDDLRPPSSRRLRGCSFGAAWAARREVLDEHGFYDALIAGSGDRAMACAAFGRFEDAMQAARLDARRAEHYLAWARPYFETVGGRVGYVDGRLLHLWHGDVENRRYLERHEEVSKLDFDPPNDIVIDEQGAWRWNTDKPDLHRYLERYFLSRQEDGSQ